MHPALLTIAMSLIFGAPVPNFAHAAPARVTPPPPVSPATTPTDYLGANVALGAQSYATSAQRSKLAGPSISLIHTHVFDDQIHSRIDLGFDALTGSTVGVLPSEVLARTGPRSVWRLREAFVQIDGLDRAVNLRVGAINQRLWGNPLLVNDFAFLGATQTARLETSAGTFTLSLEQAVPPTTFSVLESASGERTPTFLGGQLEYFVGATERNFFRASAGYFEFQKLTTAQARQSLYFGNSIVGDSTTANFLLAYRGIQGGLHSGFAVTDSTQLLFGLSALRNVAAPAGSNFGYLAKLGVKTRVNAGKLTTEVGYFDDQSDSSPAVFTDPFLNAKNHRGFMTNVRFDNELKRYALTAGVTHAKALVPQAFVGDNTTVVIGLEVHYDLIP